MNIDCHILSHGCFTIFLNLISGWGWFPWQQDGESIPLLSEGIQSSEDHVESLHEIDFMLPFQIKRHNIHNFALVVASGMVSRSYI